LCACFWDYDTLQMERSRFPSALELITGKFLRHSPEFYSWRIEDRQRRLRAEPDNLALYDDLAVAYDKTGAHDKAIETILRSHAKSPDRYETVANLGTLYVHAGQLEKGLEYIDRAIRINPDAHFGREKYQKYLVEYVLSNRKDGRTPLPISGGPYSGRNNFVAFLAGRQQTESLAEVDYQAALKGVLGMMKFGQHDSPVLLEALGDLLVKRQDFSDRSDAKRLAARAYLKASYAVREEAARTAYRGLATRALTVQTRHPDSDAQLPLEELEASFRRELADADTWYADLAARERAWVAEGKNPEAEFDRLYDREPVVVSPEDGMAPTPAWRRWLPVGVGIVCTFAALGVLLAVGVGLWKRFTSGAARPPC
jgi:tetratricopeptide (TPR) repeat protein